MITSNRCYLYLNIIDGIYDDDGGGDGDGDGDDDNDCGVLAG